MLSFLHFSISSFNKSNPDWEFSGYNDVEINWGQDFTDRRSPADYQRQIKSYEKFYFDVLQDIEDRSRDTYENMKNSLKQIENECGKGGKIVIVTSGFHSKRAKGMLEKMTPLNIYSYGLLDGKHDLEILNHYNFSTRRLIRTEALLLSWYTQRGIINDKQVTSINRKLR